MNETAAAWVRSNAWSPAVHAEAKHPGSILGLCLCLQQFITASCHGGNHDCSEVVAFAAETVLIGTAGWVYDRTTQQTGAPVSLWLGDRICVQRCGCTCHGNPPSAPAPAELPVQLDLFGVSA
ncbi:DUF6248 family natural product biosynthesis protein [Streptomyces sp. NBC_01511]|uniref:DUF6248 family natural product biosynthesis protein n=1 Tax=Streptomyces sp. NBC_01511 TaxID=2903889 RepID=UPI003865335A